VRLAAAAASAGSSAPGRANVIKLAGSKTAVDTQQPAKAVGGAPRLSR
jgi:hypothetical protein